MDTENNKITAILLMAGSGSRFGSLLPKQFHRMGGKKVYQHTLDVFILSGLFDEILLVCSPEKMEEVRKEIDPSIRIIPGGATRQESSYLGLLAASDSHIVCIHDAVRPFVTTEILKENISKAIQYGAVNTCIASTDTVVYAPQNPLIHSIPSRSDYLRGQTPQTFHYPLILQAHRFAREKGVANCTDDCTLVHNMSHPVHISQGCEYNIKITTELDLSLSEQIFRLRHNTIPVHSPSSLKGKHFIVTGGTGGIGKALCEMLEKEEAIPIPLSRSSSPYTADLTSYDSAHHAFQHIHADYGPVDGLINSIGHLILNPLADLSPQDIGEQISINLKALIFSCKCALLKKGAHIVNIASSSYARGRKDFTVYSSAKAAVVNFTQGLAEERPDLLINAIVPQRTQTPLRLKNFALENPDTLLDPCEVAQEIVSLLKQNVLKGSVVEIRKK
jgi:ribitol-5-phosphate 2-dehydrogenase (NADP+) / D-ribitol-5-phosphate cytidylyltransferase